MDIWIWMEILMDFLGLYHQKNDGDEPSQVSTSQDGSELWSSQCDGAGTWGLALALAFVFGTVFLEELNSSYVTCVTMIQEHTGTTLTYC